MRALASSKHPSLDLFLMKLARWMLLTSESNSEYSTPPDENSTKQQSPATIPNSLYGDVSSVGKSGAQHHIRRRYTPCGHHGNG